MLCHLAVGLKQCQIAISFDSKFILGTGNIASSLPREVHSLEKVDIYTDDYKRVC